MSEANKTEEPTQKKIEDARQKEGNVLHSNDVIAFLEVVACLGVLYLTVPDIPAIFHKTLLQAVRLGTHHNFSHAVTEFFDTLFWEMFVISAIVFATIMLAGIVANFIQVGPYFSFAKLTKGGEAINPINNAKNLFSKRTLSQFLLSLAKVAIIVMVAYAYLKDRRGVNDALASCNLDILCGVEESAAMVGEMLWWIILFMLPLAVLDFFLQYRFYMDDQKMSKDEVKREHRDLEGDPEMKQHRKGMAQEILFGDGMSNLNQASVVLRNPTHYAVAIRYMPTLSPTPFILAKGAGPQALAIIAEAERLGLPQYQDVPLTRTIYAACDVHEFIPQSMANDLINMVHWLYEHYPQFVYEEPPK